MKFLFVDETIRSGRSRYFLGLCGIVVDKSNLFQLNDAIADLKKEYEINNLKELRTVSFELKRQSTEDLFRILDFNEVIVISAIIGQYTIGNIYNQTGGARAEAEIRSTAFIFIAERFVFHLRRQQTIKKGYIVFDSLNPDIEKIIREESYNFISRRNYKHTIYPSIAFSNDEHSEILQASDLIALALNNAIYNSIRRNEMSLNGLNVENLPNENPFLEKYWPLFERNIHNNKVEGWGVKIWR